MNKHRMGRLFIVALIVFISRIGSADVLPSPEIYSLSQQDQDVNLVITTCGSGLETDHPGVSALELVRHRGSNSISVLGPKVFSDDEVVDVDVLCKPIWDSDPNHCDAYPEECVDCDEDEQPECYGSCFNRYCLSVVDECVTPGATIYQLFVYGGENWEEDEEPSDLGVSAIMVENTGDTCLNGGDNNCSVINVSGSTHPVALWLAFGMLAIGLVVARVQSLRSRSK